MNWTILFKNTIVALIFVLSAAQVCFAQKAAQKAPAAQITQDTTKQTNYEQQAPFEQQIRRSADLEIDGLVVDETITKIGRDFYDIFLMQWEAPVLAKNFTVLIKEQPTRGTGAVVSVLVNDVLLLEQALQPRYDIIEEVANYAAAITHQYLLEDQLSKQLEADGKKAREVF